MAKYASEWIYWRMRVSLQHPILEIKKFITFGKAVNGSSSFPRLLYSSLTPNNKQSGDL